MTCEELLEALNEYVDGTLDLQVCEKFADHIADCNPCQIVIDNIRKSISLYKNGEPFPLPQEFQNTLRDNLLKRWKQKFPQHS